MHLSGFFPVNHDTSIDVYFVIDTVYYVRSNVIISRLYRTKPKGCFPYYAFVTILCLSLILLMLMNSI